MDIRQFAENALTIQMGEEIDEQINRKLVALRHHIEGMDIEGIDEIVLSYTSLIIYFDIFKTDAGALKKTLEGIDEAALLEEEIEYRVIEIPVCYGGTGRTPAISGKWPVEQGSHRPACKQGISRLHARLHAAFRISAWMRNYIRRGWKHQGFAYQPVPVGIGGRQTGMYPFESRADGIFWDALRCPCSIRGVRRRSSTRW